MHVSTVSGGPSGAGKAEAGVRYGASHAEWACGFDDILAAAGLDATPRDVGRVAARRWREWARRERVNGQVQTRIIVGLPRGLTRLQYEELGAGIAHDLATCGGEEVPGVAFLHLADADNPHLHVYLYVRGASGSGRKIRIYGQHGRDGFVSRMRPRIRDRLQRGMPIGETSGGLGA